VGVDGARPDRRADGTANSAAPPSPPDPHTAEGNDGDQA